MIAEAMLLDALEAVHSGRLRVHEAYRTIRAAETEATASNVSIGDKRLTWRELVERQDQELLRLNDFARIVMDLDRNEHGRHEGDIDSSDPSGISQGNPHLVPGATLGYGLRGRVYRMPPRGQRHDPAAWEVAS